jgi:hypothetical protein
MLARKTGTKHTAPAADRRAFAGSVIVGRLRPEILRHIRLQRRFADERALGCTLD